MDEVVSRSRKKHMDSVYSKYWIDARESMTYPEDEKLCELITNHVPAKSIILDVGVGTGHPHAGFLSNQNYVVHGIDISSLLIKRCKELHPEVISKVGDAENLDYQSNYFDVVYCFHSTWYFPDLVKALKEMIRVCKKGGYIFLDIENLFNPEVAKDFSRRKFENKGLGRVLKFSKNIVKWLLRRKSIPWNYVIIETPTNPEIIHNLKDSGLVDRIVAYAFNDNKLKSLSKGDNGSLYPKLIFSLRK